MGAGGVGVSLLCSLWLLAADSAAGFELVALALLSLSLKPKERAQVGPVQASSKHVSASFGGRILYHIILSVGLCIH